MSGWYIGNILFGGIIELIVDAANGAMFNRTPAEVNVTLSGAPVASLHDGVHATDAQRKASGR